MYRRLYPVLGAVLGAVGQILLKAAGEVDHAELPVAYNEFAPHRRPKRPAQSKPPLAG